MTAIFSVNAWVIATPILFFYDRKFQLCSTKHIIHVLRHIPYKFLRYYQTPNVSQKYHNIKFLRNKWQQCSIVKLICSKNVICDHFQENFISTWLLNILVNFGEKIYINLIFGGKIYSSPLFLFVAQTFIPIIEERRYDSCAICPPKSKSLRSCPHESHKSRVFLLIGWLNNTCNRIVLNRLSGTRKVHDACHVGRVMRQHFDELFRLINLSLNSHTEWLLRLYLSMQN